MPSAKERIAEQEAVLRLQGPSAYADYDRLISQLATLAEAVGTAADIREIFHGLLDFAEASVPCDGLFVSLYDRERNHRVCVYSGSKGEDDDVSELPPMPMNNSPNSRAIKTGQIVVIDDFQRVMAGLPVVSLGVERDPRLPQSSVAVPLIVLSEVIGAFEVQSVQLNAFRPEHITSMQMAASLAAIATRNVQLLERERQRRLEAEAVAEALAAENELRRALQSEQFVVYYQPIASVDTQEILAVEALVRWEHPEKGLVPPMDFIPALEQTGLIIQLGEWVLRTACTQIRALREAADVQLRLAVNLSPRQFQEQSLTTAVKRILRETRFEPNCLELEITESAAMQDVELTKRVFDELSALGVSFAMDDFGTGYSSLSYLNNFEFRTIKIDRSFVENVSVNGNNATIVGAIVALAHSLDIKTIGEGVETEDQLAFLRERGCQEFQGFLLARPLPFDGLIQFFAQHAAQSKPRD